MDALPQQRSASVRNRASLSSLMSVSKEEMQCNPAIELRTVTQSGSLHRPRPVLHLEYHEVTYLVLP